MTTVYIILGVLGYILVSSLVFILYSQMYSGKNFETLFAAMAWPISLPFCFKHILFMCVAFLVRWTAERIEDLFKKKES